MDLWEIILIVIGVIFLYYIYSLFMYGSAVKTVSKKMSSPKTSRGKGRGSRTKKK